ncbi:hypothetical protein ACWE42_08715 [Sutcliffiella cohnii]|nr:MULTISPECIES: hypothetical protein [Sutcliffiella]MED4015574.1 hypothetical protein [Sutcliffiella cohnii]WBL15764.1 hypothetical protein O1A01_03685 [Sutcliffiella sp. NC1]
MKNRKLLLLILIMVMIIAGVLDLIFEGLFYQMLPESVQSMISNSFNR